MCGNCLQLSRRAAAIATIAEHHLAIAAAIAERRLAFAAIATDGLGEQLLATFGDYCRNLIHTNFTLPGKELSHQQQLSTTSHRFQLTWY
jgi:hypothetical protein